MYLYWLYYVQILLMILHILMYFLGGLHVALAGVLEPKKKFVKAVHSGFATCLLTRLPTQSCHTLIKEESFCVVT